MRRIVLNTLIILMMLTSFCFANNVISSVTITKNGEASYNLSVNSTEVVKYKKVLEDNNTVYFDLKNSTISDTIETKYDDPLNIKSVAVRPIGKNKVRIYIEGLDANNSIINFQNGKTSAVKELDSIDGFRELESGIILFVLMVFGIILAQIKEKLPKKQRQYQNYIHNGYKSNIIKAPNRLPVSNPIRRNITINDYQKQRNLIRQKNPYMAEIPTNSKYTKVQTPNAYKSVKSV